MMMGEKPQLKSNRTITTLRGFNNTPENIRNQRDLAQIQSKLNSPLTNWQVRETHPQISSNKPKYDPSKQRENFINLNLLNKR